MRIGFIGCGNMGGAVASALCEHEGYDVHVFDVNEDFCKSFCQTSGAVHEPSLKALFNACEALVIAVKPQVLAGLYPTFRTLGSARRKWISLAAGVPLEVLSSNLETHDIVRFMSNLAARSKAAVTAVCSCASCDMVFAQQAQELAGLFGEAFYLEERLFGAFIGVSASGIAYVLEMVHAMAMGATDQGIAYPAAVKMASATLKSAAALIESDDQGPAALMTRVCSAAGTTIKGMKALSDGGFDACVQNAVIKASERAIELERKAKESL